MSPLQLTRYKLLWSRRISVNLSLRKSTWQMWPLNWCCIIYTVWRFFKKVILLLSIENCVKICIALFSYKKNKSLLTFFLQRNRKVCCAEQKCHMKNFDMSAWSPSAALRSRVTQQLVRMGQKSIIINGGLMPYIRFFSNNPLSFNYLQKILEILNYSIAFFIMCI